MKNLASNNVELKKSEEVRNKISKMKLYIIANFSNNLLKSNLINFTFENLEIA